MNKKIIIENNDKTIYKGKMLNMPVKETSIKAKSIDLFDDEDPCIIHQSYVMKHFAEDLHTILTNAKNQTITLKDHQEALDFLDVEPSATIKLKG